MAITVNTVPANISNSGAFNVTTDLTEDASHVNLRIRAAITVSAVVVATIEKPKGLPDFDFAEILKPLVPGISFARDSGDLVKVSGGSPLVAYTVLFTEVYEVAGVTTTGDTDTASGTTYRYVPCKGDGGLFSTYVMAASPVGGRFANRTLSNNICKFFTSNPKEYWLVFFTEVTDCTLYYSKDSGAWDSTTNFTTTDGWGVVVVNIGELFSGVASDLRIQIYVNGGVAICDIITIYSDSSEIDERVVLEYDGIVGGKEYLAFEGIKDISFDTERKYITGSGMNKKPLSFKGINKQSLETRFKDINNASYLKSLLVSEDVKKLEPLYAAPTEVTITTDSVRISNSEMFTNQLDIEYEY